MKFILCFLFIFFTHLLALESFIDSTGKNIKIETPLKIISLDPFSSQFLKIFSLDENILLADTGRLVSSYGFLHQIFPQNEEWKKYFSTQQPQVEELLKLKPNLIFSKKGLFQHDSYKNFKVPIAEFSYENMADLFKSAEQIASLKKQESQYKIFRSYFDQKKETRMKIYIVSSNITSTYGNQSYQASLVQKAGGLLATQNITQVKTKITLEQIIIENPDIILVENFSKDSVEDILSMKSLQKVKAIENKKVFKVPSGILSWLLPCPESALGFLWLKNMIHQEKFNIEDIFLFYKKFYKFSPEKNYWKINSLGIIENDKSI